MCGVYCKDFIQHLTDAYDQDHVFCKQWNQDEKPSISNTITTYIITCIGNTSTASIGGHAVLNIHRRFGIPIVHQYALSMDSIIVDYFHYIPESCTIETSRLSGFGPPFKIHLRGGFSEETDRENA